MVAFYTARICEFFVEHLCSGLWSSSFSVFPPPISYFSSFHSFISVTGAQNGGSWLGCGDLPPVGAVFYLGAGWPQWKPLGIPGTHLPLKRGSWLTFVLFFKPHFFYLLVCFPLFILLPLYSLVRCCNKRISSQGKETLLVLFTYHSTITCTLACTCDLWPVICILYLPPAISRHPRDLCHCLLTSAAPRLQ